MNAYTPPRNKDQKLGIGGLALLACLAIALCGLISSPRTAHAAVGDYGTLEDGTYTISSKVSSWMCVEVAGGSTSNTAKVQSYKSNGTAAQVWKITTDSDGYSTIINVKSGKALDVPDGTAANGKQLQQYTPNGTEAQKWKIIENSDGYFKIVSALDESLAIDLAYASTANGTAVWLSNYPAMNAQSWAFTNISVKNYTEMPFYTDKQLAGQLTWHDDSSIVPLSETSKISSYWGYPETAYNIKQAGDGILIQNAGTDLDGDSFDLKIVANSVKGNQTECGLVLLEVQDSSHGSLEVGDGLSITFSSPDLGEASFTVSYLKHGTSDKAQVAACPSFYDIDAGARWSPDASFMFGGNEGISLTGNTGTCFVTYWEDMGISEATGKFWCSNSESHNLSGKDPDASMTLLTNSSQFTLTYSAFLGGIDMYMDANKAIYPKKSVKITS